MSYRRQAASDAAVRCLPCLFLRRMAVCTVAMAECENRQRVLTVLVSNVNRGKGSFKMRASFLY